MKKPAGPSSFPRVALTVAGALLTWLLAFYLGYGLAAISCGSHAASLRFAALLPFLAALAVAAVRLRSRGVGDFPAWLGRNVALLALIAGAWSLLPFAFLLRAC